MTYLVFPINSNMIFLTYCIHNLLCIHILFLHIVQIQQYSLSYFKSEVNTSEDLSKILLMIKNFIQQIESLYLFFLILYHILKLFMRKFKKILFATLNTINTAYVPVVYPKSL